MAETRDLDTILADAKEELATLERNRAALAPARGREIIAAIEAVTEEWRRFVPEQEARLRSGRSVEWLRGRFAEWREQGHARLQGGKRYYRLCVIPHRADLIAAREAGRRGETKVAS